MVVKLLTEHHLEFLSLLGGCTGSSEYVYSCQNATLLEITCRGSFIFVMFCILISGLKLRVRNKNLIFLFLNPKQMLWVLIIIGQPAKCHLNGVLLAGP